MQVWDTKRANKQTNKQTKEKNVFLDQVFKWLLMHLLTDRK